MRLLGRLILGIILILFVIAGIAFGYDFYASSRVLEEYPPQGSIISINGIDTHVICQGEGEETLVLFHGFAGGAIDMIPLMNALETEMQVCSFDRPGNDYASAIPANWTMADSLAWHNAVIAIIAEGSAPIAENAIGSSQSLNLATEVYVAGHSLGEAYALAYAAEYPVSGIISLDGLSPEIADTVVARMGTYANLKLLAQLGLLRPISGNFAAPEYDETLSAQMVALRSRSQNIAGFADEGSFVSENLTTEALTAAVDLLDIPMLIFAAEQTSVAEGQAFTDSLIALDANYAQSELITVPDARHYLIVTHADLLAENIIEWINAQ